MQKANWIRLKEMGFNSYVDTVLRKGKTLYVLKMGDFTDREEAKKTQNILRKKAPKLKAYILRENVQSKNICQQSYCFNSKMKKKQFSEKRKHGTEKTNPDTVSKLYLKGYNYIFRREWQSENVPVKSTDKNRKAISM